MNDTVICYAGKGLAIDHWFFCFSVTVFALCHTHIGLDFWKVGRRKIFAVKASDLKYVKRERKQVITVTDSEGEYL